MPRLTLVLAALAGVLAGGAAVFFLARPAEPALDVAAVRAVVEEVLAEREAGAAAPIEVARIDPAVLNPMIETYLMADPTILQRMSAALDTQLRASERAETAAALAAVHADIYEAEGHVVLGNPEGDVTLVEMFDYNCTYCRGALPDLVTLLAEDEGLRVILKEFPILSEESVDAARVSVLVARSDADYWAYHQALFSARGRVDKETALAAAADLGLSRVALELDMHTDAVTRVLQQSYRLAQALNISGTPTYIIGDEVIPGAIGVEELRQRIANVRECGSTQC